MTNPYFEPETESFSAGYELVGNARVHLHGGDKAIIDFDMLDALREEFGAPVIGYIGGRHYQFEPQKTIPSGSAAVPEDRHDDPAGLLIQK